MQASDLVDLVPDCCHEVLESMYFTVVLSTVVLCTDHRHTSPLREAADCAYRLRFEGEISGTFGISVESRLAQNLAANFLGEEEHALSSLEVFETMGELANMLCGSVLSRVASAHTFALSHPESILPESLTPEGVLDSFELHTDAGRLTVWIAIEGNIPEGNTLDAGIAHEGL